MGESSFAWRRRWRNRLGKYEVIPFHQLIQRCSGNAKRIIVLRPEIALQCRDHQGIACASFPRMPPGTLRKWQQFGWTGESRRWVHSGGAPKSHEFHRQLGTYLGEHGERRVV